MRAMILAAGLGTRMRPLSDLRAKPALPVLGRPVIGYLLALLRHHGVEEVLVNLHHLPDSLREAVEASRPDGMRVEFSLESEPLGTGGGIRRAKDFLAESAVSLVLAGDMLLDVDLSDFAWRHLATDSACTLMLRHDPRAAGFGTIGIAEDGGVRRIAGRFDLGGETQAGVFVGVRAFSPQAFSFLPEEDCFEDLSDWLAPALAAGRRDIRGRIYEAADCVWEPVGTPAEYLRANLAPPRISYFSPTELVSPGTKILGGHADVVLGAGSRLGRGAKLARCVVWEGESVPEGQHARDGVFAAGAFHPCDSDS